MKLKLTTAAFFSAAWAISPLSSDDYGSRIQNCPGYAVNNAITEQTANGLKAHLQLAGDACNAFGDDVQNLILEATYETKERLHVKIYDEVRVAFVEIVIVILTAETGRKTLPSPRGDLRAPSIRGECVTKGQR